MNPVPQTDPRARSAPLRAGSSALEADTDTLLVPSGLYASGAGSQVAGNGRVHVAPSGPRKRGTTNRKIIKGKYGVRVVPTEWTDKTRGKTYRSWTIIWRDARGRHREKRADLEQATKRQEQIEASIGAGDATMLSFSQADRANNLAALQNLDGTGKSLVQSTSEYAEMHRILKGRCTPVEAARSYIASHPATLIPLNTPEVVEEYLSRGKRCAKWQRNLRRILEAFAQFYQGPLCELHARAVETWLGTQKGNLTTRRGRLDVLRSLVIFARDKGYLAKDAEPFAGVDDPEPDEPEVNLYTPEELQQLLDAAEGSKAGQKLIPFITITAFAGVRHGEMNEEKARLLDWSDIDFEARSIYVAKGTAKTGNDRTVDIPDNLIAWLQSYAQPGGKICALAYTADALGRLKQKAGITGNKRNALRKSFISYKNALTRDIAGVADQAGNSAGIIRKNYKRTGTRMREAAERWFKIVPKLRAQVEFAWVRNLSPKRHQKSGTPSGAL